MKTITISAAIMMFGLALPGSASAQSVAGTWLREGGTSRVRVAPCGDALCGTITWLKSSDSPAKVGQRIFYDMKPSGDSKWSGKAFNPEDGKTYSGNMAVSGSSMTTQGCTLGGLICRSVKWTKAE